MNDKPTPYQISLVDKFVANNAKRNPSMAKLEQRIGEAILRQDPSIAESPQSLANCRNGYMRFMAEAKKIMEEFRDAPEIGFQVIFDDLDIATARMQLHKIQTNQQSSIKKQIADLGKKLERINAANNERMRYQ